MSVISFPGAEPRLRLVPRAPGLRRLSVRINALDGHSPYGRSPPFRITEDDLWQLVEIAARMERRA